MDTPRPVWLKAMIVLVATTIMLSIFAATESGFLVMSIRVLIFTIVLVGLLLNSQIARWASVILFLLVSLGGIGSLCMSFGNENLSIGILIFLAVTVLIVLSISSGLAFSQSSRAYYQMIKEHRNAEKL
ncbi:hypothetical protein GCM10027181_12720 [Rheinheimera gaetbuli]